METKCSVRLKRVLCHLYLLSQLLVLLIATGAPLSQADSSMEDNEDANHEHLSPCDFDATSSGYCQCDNDLDKLVDVTCGFYKYPSEEEWKAIARFRTVTIMKFRNRPKLAINQAPPSYVFGGMKSLCYFSMSLAGVDTIPSHAFHNSTSLADIDLTDNQIRTLEPYAFANLINLTDINLKDNLLSEINRKVFVNLPKLREIVLNQNQIQVVHDYAFQDLKNLEELALKTNNLTVITREVFYGLQRMKNLDLHENFIDFIGAHVFAEMPRLQDLDLSHNKILSISAEAFSGLKNLARLNLKDNKIVKLYSETFSHFRAIHFLDLRSNELETLDFSLVKPIYANLMNMNMQLLIAENRFSCGCQILWLRTLYEETESENVKRHILLTSCNLFDHPSKNVAHSPSSISFNSQPSSIHKADKLNITILTSPPEETTTYAFESVRQVVNLTAEDFNCRQRDGKYGEGEGDSYEKDHDTHEMQSQDSSVAYHHNHHDTVTKSSDEEADERYRQHVLSPIWKANSQSHQQNFPPGFSTSGGRNAIEQDENEVDKLETTLREPQATAALEGDDDLRGNLPKRTSHADQKVDTARVSSTHTGLSTSSGASLQLRNCDSVFVSVALAIFTVLLRHNTG